MTMQWKNRTEQVLGLIWLNEYEKSDKGVSSSPFTAQDIHPDYRDLFNLIKEGSNKTQIVASSNQNQLNAIQAAGNVSMDIEEVDWWKILHDDAEKARFSQFLDSQKRALEKGKDIDPSKFQDMLRRYILKDSVPFKSLFDVEEVDNPLIKSGIRCFDEIVGGLPSPSLIIVTGEQKHGKTTLALHMLESYLHNYPDKNAFMFTFEMSEGQLKYKYNQVRNKEIPEETTKRLQVDDVRKTGAEVIARASSVENLGMIVLDFAGFAIRGKPDEPSFTELYMDLAAGAKELNCIIVCISQLSKNYNSTIPDPEYIRYSSVARQVAAAIYTVYDPDEDDGGITLANDYGITSQYESQRYIIYSDLRFRKSDMKFPRGIIEVRKGRNGSWLLDEKPYVHPFIKKPQNTQQQSGFGRR